jgi:CheY-like chemotaxis protein
VFDFAMPGMNGAELARAARQLRPHMKIVFASGYAETEALETLVGPDTPVLRKPFTIGDLATLLRRQLG